MKFEYFGEYAIKNPKYWVEIRYKSLMRFYLYMKLLKYDGDSPMILSYVKGLKDKDEKKMEIINKIPNNNHVLNMINANFNLNYPDYNYDNLQDLKKFINNNNEILSDNAPTSSCASILYYYSMKKDLGFTKQLIADICQVSAVTVVKGHKTISKYNSFIDKHSLELFD